MRIGIDCRLAGTRHAGIGRYIENLVLRLPAKAPQIKWVLFLFDQKQCGEIFKNQELPKNCELVFVPVRHYTLKEQFVLPFFFYQAKLDLLHTPHFNIPVLYFKKIVVTIHDLLWHEQKGSSVTTLSPLMYWTKYWLYLYITKLAVARAQCIFVPTKTVEKVIRSLYPKMTTPILITKEGAATQPIKPAQPKQDKKASQEPVYLLYVGSLYPHKNVGLVVEALKTLPKVTLKLVGSKNVFHKTIEKKAKEHGVSGRVEYLGYQTDAALTKLYRSAVALVQPSLSEGFGLTGVEAMALGTPVIASDIPIFREVYQDGAIFFDPHSVASFCKAVSWLNHPTNKNKITQKGKTVAKQYDWDTTTSTTLAGYTQVLAP